MFVKHFLQPGPRYEQPQIRSSFCCSEWKKRDKAQRVQRERAEKKVGHTCSPDQVDLNVSLAEQTVTAHSDYKQECCWCSTLRCSFAGKAGC